jgi:hypothetical protein
VAAIDRAAIDQQIPAAVAADLAEGDGFEGLALAKVMIIGGQLFPFPPFAGSARQGDLFEAANRPTLTGAPGVRA